MRRILIIARKELLVLFCNPVSRMMIILPPFIQLITFGFAATLEVRNVNVAVLNSDSGYWSREILNQIQASPTFKKVFYVNSEEELKKIINIQDALLAVVFDQEFSRSIVAGNTGQMLVILDGRRSNAAQIAAWYISQISQGVVAQTPKAQTFARNIPQIDTEIRSWFNPNLEFRWFFLPNLIGMIGLMMGLVVTGLSVAREKEMGTFDQLLVSPATPLEIAFGKLIPGCGVAMFQGIIFVIITYFGFGVPVMGSLFILVLGLLLFTIASSSLGLMISSIASTQQQAFLGAFAFGVPCILISGAITPLLNMPPFLQYLSQLNPLRYFTTIVQGVFLKDITLIAAGQSLIKIFIISVVCLSIAIWMFKAGK